MTPHCLLNPFGEGKKKQQTKIGNTANAQTPECVV
jgi:hypothetical protein